MSTPETSRALQDWLDARHKPTVLSFDARVVHFVETDAPEFPRFIRFSEDNWRQEMGMSYEEVTTVDVEALEAAFQQHCRTLPKREETERRCAVSAPIDDGGPAFPHSSQPLDAQGNPIACNHTEWGMSLRDWLAGQEQIAPNEEFGWELCEALAGPRPKVTYKDNPLEWFNWSNKWQAAVRYARADAMLAARKGGAR